MAKKIRIVVTTRTDQVIYGRFAEITPEYEREFERLKVILRNLKDANHLTVINVQGDEVYINPDCVAFITLEESKE